MSEEILSKFLLEMGEMLKQAKDFSLEQLPLVAREILQFNLANSLMWFVISILMLIGAKMMMKSIKKIIADSEDSDAIGLYIAPGIVAVIGVSIFITQLHGMLKIYFAPRMYLLEYIAGLIPHGK